MTKWLLTGIVSTILLSQTSAPATPSPAQILHSAGIALQSVESVAYEVRREYPRSTARKVSGRTTVRATRTPFRFSATFEMDDKSSKEMAVSDGVGMRVSTKGTTEDSDFVFASGYPKDTPMRIMNEPTVDVAGTWRILLDRAYMTEIAASHNSLYLKQEDIEGDLCHVLLVVRDSQLYESTTTYYWISAKTGLPRAVQVIRLSRGETQVTPRFVLTNLRLSPVISPEIFLYKPTAADSMASVVTREPAGAVEPVSPSQARSCRISRSAI